MAGSLIGALRVTLGIDTAAFEQGLGIAQKRLNAAGKNMQAFGDRMTGIGANLSIGITAPLVAFGATAVSAANESSAALAQVEAALKSMGPVAGKSSEQLQQAAADLQHISTFDDDDILKSVTANMLTFGNVTGDVFDRAQLAAVNLSARLGQDLQSSAIQLGKALNDPIKGITALSRVGVSFTEQQKDQIKAMVAAGDTAGAQSLILSELEKQYGGAAKAARDAAPGSDTIDAWRNFQETVGAIIVNVLPPLTDILTGVLDSFNNLSPGMQTFVVGAAAVAAAIGPILTIVGSLISVIGGLAPVFAPVLALIGEAGLAGALGAAATAAAPFVAAGAALAAAWYLFGDKIGPVLSALKEKFQEVLGPKLQALFATVKATLTDLWNGPFGQAIRVVIDVLGDLGAAYTSVLGEVLIRIISTLVTVVQNAFKIIGDVFNVLGKLLTGDFSGAWEAVKTLVGDVVNGWIAVLNSLAPEAVAAMRAMVLGIQEWIKNKLGEIFAWLGKKIEDVKGWFFGLYDAVVGHSYIPDMVDEIGQNMARLQALMVDPAKKATDATKDAFRQLQEDTASLLDRLFPVQAQIRSIMDDMATLDEAMKKGLITPEAYAQGKKVLEGQLAQINIDATKATADANKWDKGDEFKSLIDNLFPVQAQIRQINSDLALLEEGWKRGETDLATYQQARTELEAALKTSQDALEQQRLASTEIGRAMIEFGQFGRDLGGSIMDALRQGIGGKNVFEALKNNFSRVLENVANKALDSVEKAIFGEGGLAGALDSLFQKLFQSIIGNAQGGGDGGIGGLIGSAIGALFGGGRASGGPVMANTPYIVGEKRPEVFVPSTAGRVIPNANALGGRTPTIYQNLTFSGAVDLATKSEVYRVADAARIAAINGIRQADRRAP